MSTTITDGSTPAPGSSGNFVGFQQSPLSGAGGPFYPAIDGANVVFGGESSPGTYGLYLCHDGQISLVAEFGSAIPGGTGDFIAFNSFSHLSGDTVVFRGTGNRDYGFYVSAGGVPRRIADTTAVSPGQTIPLISFGYPVISGNAVYFNGRTASPTAYIATPTERSASWCR